jgi:hypothetical protein
MLFGSFMGCSVLDFVSSITDENALSAYSTVFILESVLLISVLVISTRKDVSKVQVRVEEAKKLEGDTAEKIV